MILLHIDLIIF